MNPTHSPVGASYAAAYARGRNAAKERVSARKNPYHRGTPAFQGWSDGHYDEGSARRITIEQHSAQLWKMDVA